MIPILGKIFFSFAFLFTVVHSYNVLMVFPGLAHSHFKLGNSLGRALAEHGHEVTLVSPFEDKNPPKGYTNVLLTGLFEKKQEVEKGNSSIFDFENMNPFAQVLFMNMLMSEGTKFTLNHPNVQKILDSNKKFDVIILEQFKHEGLHVLQCHYKAPLILMNTLGANVWVNGYVANPAPPSYIPDTFVEFSERMNFWERAFNGILVKFEQIMMYFTIHLKQYPMAIEKFPHCAHEKFAKNVSLVFLNAHESITYPVPLVPNMINIGGFHIDPPKALPKDLKDLLDNSPEGVIYFCLGSNLKSSEIKPEIKQAIVKSLGKLKQKVLWKYEDDSLKAPKNVVMKKWLPQQDILAHPNVKLFITHGGLLSLIETVQYGVPVIVLPVFGDQKMNAAKVEITGYGEKIPFSEITEERLDDALHKLLNNPKYSETARKLSDLSRDRPIQPLDLAIYWTEYIAKHKGAPHLRVAGLDITWYQYFLLDVIALIVVVVVFVLVLFLTLCYLCYYCRNKANKKAKRD